MCLTARSNPKPSNTLIYEEAHCSAEQFVGLALGFLRVRPFLRPTSRPSRTGGWAGLSLPSEEVGRKRRSEARRQRLPGCRRGGHCPHGAAWAEQSSGSHAVPGPSHRDWGAREAAGPLTPSRTPPENAGARVRGRASARESTPGPARPLPGEPGRGRRDRRSPACAPLPGRPGPGRGPDPGRVPGLWPRPPPSAQHAPGLGLCAGTPTLGPGSGTPARNPALAPELVPGLRPPLPPSPPPPAVPGQALTALWSRAAAAAPAASSG